MLPTALECDRFVALTPTVADELAAAGVDRARIVQIPNGVDTTTIALREPSESSVELRVVFVGRLHAQKALDNLVEAVALCERRSPGAIRLAMLGEGPERQALERQIATLGLGHVVEVAGAVTDVASRLAEFDAFVLPSLAEGLSNALLEAMAAGLPVVASDIPGNHDVVTHGHNGLLFSPGSVDQLADRLSTLATDEPLRARLAANARETIESTYGLEKIRIRYVALYEEPTSARESVGRRR
jgi:glycosyltransferase involved in cell wall biosynthesis